MTRGQSLAVLLIGAALCAVPLGGAAIASGGKAEEGQAVFADKRCGDCHRPASGKEGAPTLEAVRRPQGEFELAGRLWNHVPAMLHALGQEGMPWPRITRTEMNDLMAYLLADPARDPVPDDQRGRVVLIRKGCLKCHSLRKEGGRVQPDLAEPRADYESAAAWAAAMWTHTPRMAEMASSQGFPYPRFVGDEMRNLLEFLRRSAAGAP